MSTTQGFEVTCKECSHPNHDIQKTITGSPSHAVIHTIADVKNTEPEDLASLYTVIDPDALNQLFQRPLQDTAQSEVAVSFSYEGYDVRITQTGDPRERSNESHVHP